MSLGTPTYLFGRTYGVVIGIQGQNQGVFYGNFSLPNSLLGGPFQSSALRVTFEIEKTAKSTSNKAKISIYNLSKTSREKFPKGGYAIQLYAGYQSIYESIYFGDIANVSSERKGGDIITSFECGEAERILEYAHFERSYKPGTTVAKIIGDLSSALNLQGVSTGPVIGVPVQVYNSGVSFNGAVKNILDVLLPPLNLKWFIQNNYLQIIPITGNNGELAALVSKTTGMIGVPSQGNNGMVKFKSLLNPGLMPGAYAVVQSETVNGTFTIQKSTFKGDSHGDNWEVECEAFQTKGAQQGIPVRDAGGFITNASGVA